ncbi:MAG TPA: hypothetical protein VKT78_16155 [Fimbriimonadaceae bacterium]|nr:hypothetical protein [Fimbriimonadaceae bacterium]
MTAEISGYRPAMSEQPLEDAALIYEAAAEQLERAAGHCRTAAKHFREREIPRAAAHAWAAFGHVRVAEDKLEDQARTHAGKSNPF